MFPHKLAGLALPVLCVVLAAILVALPPYAALGQEKPAQEKPARSLADVKKEAAVIDLQAAELRWLEEIPWVLSLAEGQKLAQQEKRPVFLWIILGSVGGDDGKLGIGSGFAAWLSDPEISKLIRENMIPVAHSAYTKDKEDAKLLLNTFHARDVGPQGFSIHTAEGEIQGAINNYKRSVTHPLSEKGLLQMLQDVLAKTEKQQPRQAQTKRYRDFYPDRGLGARSDGSVRLALTSRNSGFGGANLGSVILTEEQFKAFNPPTEKVGTRYEVPDDTLRLFANAISAMNSGISGVIIPKDIKTARLSGEVLELKEGRGIVRLKGRLQAAPFPHDPADYPGGSTDCEGYLQFERGKIQSLLLVFEGSFRWNKDRLMKTRAVARWALTVEEDANLKNTPEK